MNSITSTAPITASNDVLSTTLEATDELSTSVIENDVKPKSLSNGIGSLAVNAIGGGGAKKKVRLRKMGSRQNSKTESDSSDEDNNHSILETPRRLKRKNYRFKQRSFDEDANSSTIAEDTVYVLKVKPGQPIRQICDASNSSRVLESGGGMSNNATFARLPLATSTSLPNVFVKTKRKVFTAIQEPMAIDGVAVIEQEILHSPTEAAQNSIPTLKEVECKTSKEPRVEKSDRRESYIRDLEIELKPRVMLVHKSISLDDVRTDVEHDDNLRKVHSVQNLSSEKDRANVSDNQGFRLPLASDSFRLLNRTRESPLKLDNVAKCENMLQQKKNKKDHLYKKNNEKQYSANALHVKGATIKKIENKIGKTHSGSLVSDTDFTKFLMPSPQKLDNTVPRIARKWERKSLTPTTQHTKFDYPTSNISEPTSPVFEQASRPMTPLNERALRIQKAKEEFLREKPSLPTVVKLRGKNLQRDANWGEKRQSDLSLSSTTADEGSVHYEEALESEDNDLHKSLSVDTIRAESPPTQSDTGTDQDFGGIYDSIPRQVTRSGKISSKLGFATLASKLRRVKGKKPKDSNHPLASNHPSTKSGSALTALCRQTIFNDIIVAPQIVSSSSEMEKKDRLPTESVMKSQSSPHALLRTPNNHSNNNNKTSAADFSRLNKSHSEQYVKRHKESYV